MDREDLEHTVKVGNFTIGIGWEPDPPHPNELEDPTIDIYEGHRSIDLGGTRFKGDAESIEHEFMQLAGIKSLAPSVMSNFRRTEVYLPVYLYNHSGYALQTEPFTDGWDSGQLGYVHIPKGRIRRTFGITRVLPDIRAVLKANLEVYVKKLQDYLMNQVFYVYLFDENGQVDRTGPYYKSTDDPESLVEQEKEYHVNELQRQK